MVVLLLHFLDELVLQLDLIVGHRVQVALLLLDVLVHGIEFRPSVVVGLFERVLLVSQVGQDFGLGLLFQIFLVAGFI